MNKFSLAAIAFGLSIVSFTAFGQTCVEGTEVISENGYALTQPSRMGGEGYECLKKVHLELKVTNADKIPALNLANLGSKLEQNFRNFTKDGMDKGLICLIDSHGMYAVKNTIKMSYDMDCYGPSVQAVDKMGFLNYLQEAKQGISYELVPTYPELPSGAVVHN